MGGGEIKQNRGLGHSFVTNKNAHLRNKPKTHIFPLVLFRHLLLFRGTAMLVFVHNEGDRAELAENRSARAVGSVGNLKKVC